MTADSLSGMDLAFMNDFAGYNNKYIIERNFLFFAKILQANGFQTALIGKIHLNGGPQGFDYWNVLPGQG
jgi:arylsulfatase A-like enzyme